MEVIKMFKTLEEDRQLVQDGDYTPHFFQCLLSTVKTNEDATHEPAEEIGDLLTFTQNLEAIEEYNNPENVYTRMEGALAKWVILPDNNVMRYCITVGKYYQKKELYDEAMPYYTRARWVGEMGNDAPNQRETLQTLNTELQQQFDGLEATLTHDYLIPYLIPQIRNCREKLTPTPATASAPTTPLSCESLSKLFELINPFADRLIQLRQKDRCKKLYDDSYLMPDFDACLKQAQTKLEKLRQCESSEREFHTLVQLLATIAAQLKRHRLYGKAMECYNLLCEQKIEEKKKIVFPFAFDVEPFHRERDVIKAEVLKKKDPPPIEGQFSWQSYRQELCELREIFKKNKKEVDTREMQRSFTDGCKGLIKKLWEDCVSLLGQPPCPFCIMGVGSISRNELAPYSDLDFALLIESRDYKGDKYFQYLVKLFALKVTLTGELDPPGFTIDANEYTSFLQRAPEDRNSIDTPSGYLSRFLPGAGKKGTESDASSQAYALHRPVLLYATQSGERLFQDFRQKLMEAWQVQTSALSTSKKSDAKSGVETSCVYQQEAEMWQAVHNYQYVEQIKFDSPLELTLHLKERYLAPLTFWISDMALKHGIFELDTLQQLEGLKSKLADEGLIDKMKEALNTLHHLRIKIQQVCHRQQDVVYKPKSNIYKPESIIKPVFTGLRFESLLQLTEEEYLSLQKIDGTVLQPAFAMTGVERVQIERLKKGINSNDRLFQAIKRGQIIEIDFLIDFLNTVENTVDLNFRDSSTGKAALHLALDHDEMLSIKIVEKLIYCKADVNIKSTETKDKVKEQTPLHIAARRGFKSIVQLLLEHQADMQLKDSKGRTPLHYAAEEGKYEVVEVLLNKCIEITKQNLIDAKDKSGNTPLHYSLVNKDRGEKIARLLLKSGADKNALNDQKWAPIHVAAAFNKPEIIEQLLTNNPDIKVDVQDAKGKTPLHWAVKPDHESVVEQLLNAGADVNIVEQEKKWTPLHYAAAGGASIQIVHWLLEKGSNPTIEDKQGQSPLALAKKAKCPQVQVVDLMLEWEKKRHYQRPAAGTSGEFNLSSRERSCSWSINKASSSKNQNNNKRRNSTSADKTGLDMIAMLPKKDHIEKDSDKRRNSMLAKKPGLNLIEILQSEQDAKKILEQFEQAEAADLAQRADNGDTLLHKIIQRQIDLHKATEFYDKSTLQQRELEALDLVSYLLQKGANIYAKNAKQETPLHKASQAGSVLLAKKVCDQAIINEYEAKRGNTALHLASEGYLAYSKYYKFSQTGDKKQKEVLDFLKENYRELIEFLHQKEANIRQSNRFSETPLHLAIRVSRNISIVEILLTLGADIEATDEDLNNVLHLATGGQLNTYGLTKSLLKRGATHLLNKENKQGIFPLHNVLAKEDYPDRRKMLSYLLKKTNISLGIKTKDLHTPLHLAVIKIDDLSVKQLLERGCDVNAQDIEGNTPLHWTVKQFEKYFQNALEVAEKEKPLQAILKCLIHHGADPKVINFKGEKPAQLTKDDLLNKTIQKYIESRPKDGTGSKNQKNIYLSQSIKIILRNRCLLQERYKRLPYDLKNQTIYNKYVFHYDDLLSSLQVVPLDLLEPVHLSFPPQSLEEEIKAEMEQIKQVQLQADQEKYKTKYKLTHLTERQITRPEFEQTLQGLIKAYQLADDQYQFYDAIYPFISDRLQPKNNLYGTLSDYCEQSVKDPTIRKEITQELKRIGGSLQEKRIRYSCVQDYLKILCPLATALYTTKLESLPETIKPRFEQLWTEVSADFTTLFDNLSSPKITSVTSKEKERKKQLQWVRNEISKNAMQSDRGWSPPLFTPYLTEREASRGGNPSPAREEKGKEKVPTYLIRK
jgi:ankyrin repeat protein